MPEVLRPVGKDVCAPCRRRVMRLAGKHDRAVVTLDNQRLVTLDVTRRWNRVHTGSDLDLPVEQLVAGTGEVHKAIDRVVTRVGDVEFATLAQNRATRELRISSDVVKMQMAVDD